MTLKARIKLHEGKRNKPYMDSVGVLTIGYGRNLDDIGISDEECDHLFERDFDRAQRNAGRFSFFSDLSKERQGVIIEMIFQLGFTGTSKFRQFIAAIKKDDWGEASEQMMDSRWHDQTPERCEELAEIFRLG
jgi:lysozyme